MTQFFFFSQLGVTKRKLTERIGDEVGVGVGGLGLNSL